MRTTVTEAPFAAAEKLGAPAPVAKSRHVVIKFGGSRLSGRTDWETMAGIVGNRLEQGLVPLVLVSAINGATNALERLLEAAGRGDEAARRAELDELVARHVGLAAQLGLDGAAVLDPWDRRTEKPGRFVADRHRQRSAHACAHPGTGRTDGLVTRRGLARGGGP
ncbi:MAG: hypothetical protein U5K76_05315 [Woeseiaceae bacterium]|nr:hypothetical protein [Woeseiaceae bacterium]